MSEEWDAFDALTTGASATPQPSQSVPEMTAIDRELDIWNQVIPQTKEIDIDILGFWKKQTATLPLLSWLARRILSIPVSSASSERVFSEGGRVVTSSRTLLNAETAEDLIWMHQNYDQLAPTIKHWVLRMSEYRKKDRAKRKEQEQAANPHAHSSQSQPEDPDDPSEAEAEEDTEYESDFVVDIEDEDDE
jgi:hypothetical protein